MFMRSVLAVAVAASLGVGAADAGTYNRYKGFFAFGDSLVDTGNTFELTEGQVPPSPPYFEGRFSNGPIWSDDIAEGFTQRGLLAANYAFGGSNALPNPDPPPVLPPDLAQQIGFFSAIAPGVANLKTAGAILSGNNDIFQNAADPDIEAVGAAAAQAVAAGAMALQSLGVDHVQLFYLPPLDLIPRYTLLQPDLAEAVGKGADAFNATLAGLVPQLEAGGLSVSTLDLHALFLALLADPGQFGLDNVTTPCLTPAGICATPELFAFWDDVHPTTVVHAQIARLVSADIAPVPLPLPAALLLVGLAGLAGVRSRARRSERRIAD